MTSAELAEDGFSDEEIAHRHAIGVLHRIHHGVHVVGRPELSFEGWCLAATLACGPGSAVSHGPAGRLHGFRRWWGPIHVSGPRSLEGRSGVVVHRPRRLLPADVMLVDGIPVTSVARTLLDLSVTDSVDRVGGWINEAGIQRVFDRREAWSVCERYPHHPGRRRFEAALALEFAPTRSGLEVAFLPIIRRAGLPPALVNSEQWSGERMEEVDFCWPELRLIVEVDGDRYHASRWRRRRDAAKDERFRGQRWKVWRVPELAITLDPGETAVRLATLGRADPSQGRV